MAKINRHQLHLLISTIAALLIFGYGVVMLSAEYRAFSESYTHERYVKALEQRTGRPYAQWREEQIVRCSREVAENKETPPFLFALAPEEWKAHLHRICMMIPITELVPESEIASAFARTVAHWVISYTVVATLLAWVLGWVSAKGIPRAMSSFWAWLTSGDKV